MSRDRGLFLLLQGREDPVSMLKCSPTLTHSLFPSWSLCATPVTSLQALPNSAQHMTPHADSKDSNPDLDSHRQTPHLGQILHGLLAAALDPIWRVQPGTSSGPPLPEASASLCVGLSQNLSFSTCPRAQDLLWHPVFPSEIGGNRMVSHGSTLG